MIPEESRNLRPYSLGGLPLDSHDHVWMLIFLADFLGSGILVSFKVATAKFFQSTLLQKLVLCQLSSFLFLTDFTRWLVSDLEKIIGASVNPTASILYKGKFTYIYSKNNPFMQENTPYIYIYGMGISCPRLPSPGLRHLWWCAHQPARDLHGGRAVQTFCRESDAHFRGLRKASFWAERSWCLFKGLMER